MIGRRGGMAYHRMSCREVVRHLQACLDGEADELTARRVAAHVDDCRRCGPEAAVHREIKSALARQETRDETTLSRLRAFGTQRRVRRQRRQVRRFASLRGYGCHVPSAVSTSASSRRSRALWVGWDIVCG